MLLAWCHLFGRSKGECVFQKQTKDLFFLGGQLTSPADRPGGTGTQLTMETSVNFCAQGTSAASPKASSHSIELQSPGQQVADKGRLQFKGNDEEDGREHNRCTFILFPITS